MIRRLEAKGMNHQRNRVTTTFHKRRNRAGGNRQKEARVYQAKDARRFLECTSQM